MDMNHKLYLRILSISLSIAFIILSCKSFLGPKEDESVICPSHETSEYVLPYPVGKTYTCTQGYVGRTYHQGVFGYAVDFSMPIGSAVTAARGGIVSFIEESFPDGDYGLGEENLIVIRHADGTYGRYVHLTKNGALVSVNQTVAQGDIIGLSGSSGGGGPHLHFDVTKDCPQRSCQTIPICFKNTKPHPYGLETGVSYTADPY
jgi:murein DD-endopeptidase MepM/ murein hydrolase activator NlpD